MRNRPNTDDGSPQGLYVEVRNGDFAKAYRRFKKKVTDDGILQELRQREFFEKPSVKRSRAKKAARSRWLKKQAQTRE